jgi:hypothetical protein
MLRGEVFQDVALLFDSQLAQDCWRDDLLYVRFDLTDESYISASG